METMSLRCTHITDLLISFTPHNPPFPLLVFCHRSCNRNGSVNHRHTVCSHSVVFYVKVYSGYFWLFCVKTRSLSLLTVSKLTQFSVKM